MSDTPHEVHESWILKTELLWAFGVGVFVAAALSMIVFTALTISVNPPSNVERIDPKTLHLSGEFAEHNLGTTVSSDGSVTVRAIATQFMFVPQCIAVPAKRRVTLRFASPDVIHGLLITGTNVNTMVIPGYIAQVHTEFTEANLGTRVDPNGRVIARVIATQFEFVPNCIVLPSERDVTMRFTSPDVIHGILVSGTNVNTMVIPGYVAQVHTRFTKTGDLLMPCHEFCGLGHSQMMATVRVVPPDQFHPGPDGRIACGNRR